MTEIPTTVFGKIVFKTLDGSLIMNRPSNLLFWDFSDFIKNSLTLDARRKGVRIVSYTINKKAGLVYALVDYL